MKVKLQPFSTPNYVIAESKSELKQDSMVESPKWHIKEVDETTLSEMCDQFRKDIFEKAGKRDPKSTYGRFSRVTSYTDTNQASHRGGCNERS